MRDSFEYIRTHYQVPAEIGRRVTAYGKPGVILGAINAYIGVCLDEDPKKRIRPYHPEDSIVYGEITDKLPLKEWEVLAGGKYGDWWLDREYIVRVWACTRSQAKYKAFKHLEECFDSAEAMIYFKARRA